MDRVRGRTLPMGRQRVDTRRSPLALAATLAIAAMSVGLGGPGSGPAAAATGFEAAGDLDPTFSGDGKLTTDLSSGLDQGSEVAVQDDGRIVIAGGAGGSGGRMFVARYLADGTPDSTFSGDGRAYTDFSPGDDDGYAMAIQADGRIVVAGMSHDSARTALARFDVNGAPDPTFSGDGKVSTNFLTGNEFADDLEVLDDGRIVLAGQAGSRSALMRYNPNGTIDTTFSGDGLVRTDFGTGPDAAFGLAVQNDGRIITTGSTGLAGAERVPVARYNSDGSLDTTFSGDGRLTINMTAGYEDATSVVVLDDGRILVAGEANDRVGLARFMPGGEPDGTFSTDGRQITNLPGSVEYASVVRLQADDRIVISGSISGYGGRALVARYQPEGTLDTSFSGDGFAAVNFTPGSDIAWGLTLQADGRIVVAGSAAGGTKVSAARLQVS